MVCNCKVTLIFWIGCVRGNHSHLLGHQTERSASKRCPLFVTSSWVMQLLLWDEAVHGVERGVLINDKLPPRLMVHCMIMISSINDIQKNQTIALSPSLSLCLTLSLSLSAPPYLPPYLLFPPSLSLSVYTLPPLFP